MIITCPYCQTRYQVAAEAFGTGGRQVQCAQCHNAWAAKSPERPAPRFAPVPIPSQPNPPLDEEQEIALDRGFHPSREDLPLVRRGPEEPDRTPEPSSLDPALLKKRQHAFSKRQTYLESRLPLARLRRAARIVAVLLLATVLIGGVVFRREVVTQFPSLADLYAALAMPVNVVGLDLRRASVVRAVRAGETVLTVNYTIASVSNRPETVPPVIVTLLDDKDAALLQWSVNPLVQEVMPGDAVAGTTQITAPPAGASRLRLTFGATRSGPAAAESPASAAAETASAAPSPQPQSDAQAQTAPGSETPGHLKEVPAPAGHPEPAGPVIVELDQPAGEAGAHR